MLDNYALAARLRQYPEVNLIGHGGEFWKDLKNVEALLQHKNMYCDLSGGCCWRKITRNVDAFKQLLVAHSEKILFGTDNTHYPLKKFLLSYDLDEGTYERIFHLNAKKLAGIA